MKKYKLYWRKWTRSREFLLFKKGVDLLSTLFFSNPLITLGVISGMIVLTLSLSLSCAIFMRFLGYPFGANWSAWDFIQYAPLAWVSEDMRGHWLFSLIAPLFMVLFLAAFALKKRNDLFGNAHWATYAEVKKAEIFSENGLFLGVLPFIKWMPFLGGRYLRVDGFEHVFVFAPSGSGKTSSLVIPNLLTWNESCIVQDVKGGIFKETSKVRAQHGQECYFWNPGTRDSHTHAYNPIDSVSLNPLLRIDDLQKIANILIPDPANGENQFFASTSRQLFVGLMLYLLDTPERPKTLGEMNRIAKNTSNFPEWIVKMLKERTNLDPLCYRNLLSFVNTEPRTQANIYQSFLSYFELFDNPLLDSATSHSDFDITQLRKKRMTIYVAAGSDNLSRLSPLLTVFYQQVMDTLLREIPNIESEPYGVLMMLDEFSALKRMEVLQKSIGLMREYRIRVMAIIQNLPQLYVTYGHDGADIFIDSKYRVAFAQNNLKAAQMVSSWLGNKTVEQKSHQMKNSFFDRSESTSVTQVPLKSPDKIMTLNKKEMIIAIEGNSPILCRKLFWFKDSSFKNRAMGTIELPVLVPFISPFDHQSMVNEFSKKEAKEAKKKMASVKPIAEESLD